MPEENEKPEVNGGRPWLMLSLNEDNTIKVQGWIDDKILCYGMLEAARDAIQKHIEKQSKIERVNGSGGLIQLLRNRK